MTAATQHELEAHLPSPPGAIRRWLAEHPRAVDNFILVWYFIGALPLAAISIFTAGEQAPSFAYLAVYSAVVALRIAAGAIALFFRRRTPLLGVILVVGSLTADTSALTLANGIALWFLLYAVPVYRDVKTGWIAYAIAVFGSFFSAFVGPWFSITTGVEVFLGAGPGDAILDAVFLLVVLLVGINLGNRRRYLQAIIDRANQLARERDQLALLAVAEERSRLAREIHDIVAHSVSVMIALSEGGARAVESAPTEAANAMRRSAETGRTALTEMRRLLGALQTDEGAELAPQPGVGDIDELVRGFVEADLNVTYSGASFSLDDRPKELAIYRIVQEGLTNVLRYAGEGASAVVQISRNSGCIEVTVRDYGSAPNTQAPATGLGSGRGLTGLAERVRVFGGTIESGPVRGEPGWRLRAVLPEDARAEPAAPVVQIDPEVPIVETEPQAPPARTQETE